MISDANVNELINEFKLISERTDNNPSPANATIRFLCGIIIDKLRKANKLTEEEI